MTKKAYSHSKWLIGAIICFAIAIFLVIGSFTFFKNSRHVSTNVSFNGEVYLSFNSNYAAIDTPLTVYLNGAGSATPTSYSWTVGKTVTNNTTSTYIPTKNDLEKFITVTVEYGDDQSATATLYCSKLPVIYINTDELIGDEYEGGTIAMQGNSEYTLTNTNFYFGDVYVKLRGNSTRYREKAPYKIKLGQSCNLFNMGESKHWVLLANDIDHSFIRNKLLYDFSSDLGASFAAESINTVLILNNEYRGVYQLCEQIRVDEERVDIYDWEQLAKDAAELIGNVKKQTEGLQSAETKSFKNEIEYALITDFSWISNPHIFTFNGTEYNLTDYITIPESTGGFILEMDFYSLQNPNGLTTNYKQPFYFNTPEYGYTNDDFSLYTFKYIQSFEYALHSQDFYYKNSDKHYEGNGAFYDPQKGWTGTTSAVFYSDNENNGKHYSELFDINSLINNFFVCEFSMNWDSMKNSVFVTKDLTGLAELNPVWDFDWAFGNNNMFRIDTNYPTSWHTTNEYFTVEQYYQSVQWNRFLIKDPYFLLLAYEKYQEIRYTIIENIIKENGLLDKYYNELYEAGVANDSKWHKTYRQYGGESYNDSMDSLRSFIETRVAWLDKQFLSFESFVDSLGYYKTSDNLKITDVTKNNDGSVTLSANSSLNGTKQISFQVNGTAITTADIDSSGNAIIKIDKSIIKDNNIVQIRAVDSSGKYITKNVDSSGMFGTNADDIETYSNYKIF